MSIDEEKLPDITDIIGEPESPDDEEDNEIKEITKKVQQYIKKHKITAKTYSKRKNTKLRELKKLVKDIDLMVLSQAYQKHKTYPEFVRKHDGLRRGLLKSLLQSLDTEGQIIVLTELLNDVCGDTEPAEHYIS